MSDTTKRGFKPLHVILISILVAALTAWILYNPIANKILETNFMNFATTVSPLSRLEIVQLKQVEVFENKSNAKYFWRYLRLPDVIIRATVPVQFNYYVELKEDWSFNRKGDVLEVTAPALKASTPAVDVSALKFEVRKGSVFRDEGEVAIDLQKKITPMLDKRSMTNMNLARETGRAELAKIIQEWMGADKVAAVKVRFADEGPEVP